MEDNSDTAKMKELIHKLVQEKKLPNVFLSIPDYCVVLFREYLVLVLNDVCSDAEDADYLDVCGELLSESATKEN